jgi:putative hydrolase of the HAD superfamily
MTPRAEALLFDLGGVIIELDWDRAFSYWAQRAGRPTEDIRAGFAFDAPYERHERGEIGADEYFASLRASLGIDLSAEEFNEGWGRIFVREIPETVALLRSLAARVPLYAFSNSNAAHQAVWSRDYARALEPFRKVFVSSGIGKRKPDREAFAHIAREIGVPLERILFFDDTMENIEGARAAGLLAVHVKGPQDVERALRPWLSAT